MVLSSSCLFMALCPEIRIFFSPTGPLALGSLHVKDTFLELVISRGSLELEPFFGVNTVKHKRV